MAYSGVGHQLLTWTAHVTGVWGPMTNLDPAPTGHCRAVEWPKRSEETSTAIASPLARTPVDRAIMPDTLNLGRLLNEVVSITRAILVGNEKPEPADRLSSSPSGRPEVRIVSDHVNLHYRKTKEQCGDGSSGLRIPDLDRPVLTSRDHIRPVGRK